MTFPLDIPALAARIKDVRKLVGLTQKEFAARIGVSRSYLSEVEVGNGKPSIEMVVGISREFPQINERWLLANIGDRLRSAEAPDREGRISEKMDFEALKCALDNANRVAKGTNNLAFFISALYGSYAAAYNQALQRNEGEPSARNWGAHWAARSADLFDPSLAEQGFAVGPVLPVPTDGGEP